MTQRRNMVSTPCMYLSIYLSESIYLSWQCNCATGTHLLILCTQTGMVHPPCSFGGCYSLFRSNRAGIISGDMCILCRFPAKIRSPPYVLAGQGVYQPKRYSRQPQMPACVCHSVQTFARPLRIELLHSSVVCMGVIHIL
jgi:hypothetical protein